MFKSGGGSQVIRSLAIWGLAFLIATSHRTRGLAAEITRLEPGPAGLSLDIPPDGKVYFLEFGDHGYSPAEVKTADGTSVAPQANDPVPLALFQDLRTDVGCFLTNFEGILSEPCPRLVATTFGIRCSLSAILTSRLRLLGK